MTRSFTLNFPTQNRLLALAVVSVSVAVFSAEASNSRPPAATVHLVSLAPPVYPQTARIANIWGNVTVIVKVRTDGSVDSVTATAGHPILKQAAVENALHSKFVCRACATTESYVILYAFRMAESAGCCIASQVPPAIQQEQRPLAAANDWQTRVTITAQRFCTCDPKLRTKRKRSLKCLYLWKCSTQ